jgi:hypothetical protein
MHFLRYGHKLSRKKAIVRTQYGKQYGYDYHFAKKPHAMGCLVPLWPKHRLAIIYVCKKCTAGYRITKKEKRKNKRKNGGFIPMPEF